MSGFAMLSVQQAIYDRLRVDPQIMGLVGSRVYDVRPQSADLPCITFGAISAQDGGTKTKQGQTINFRIQCWSVYEGRLQLMQMAEAVYAMLHAQPLTATGIDPFVVRCTGMETVDDADGGTRQMVITVSAMCIETP